MPRCSNCGKVNREGSLFCQDCGHRLGDSGAAPRPVAGQGSGATPTATEAAPSGPTAQTVTCSSCGVANPQGMNFCKMCGAPLSKAPAAAASPARTPGPAAAAPPGRTACPHCGGETPVSMPFCQHCGQRLAPAASSTRSAPVTSQAAVAATIAVPSGQPAAPAVPPGQPAAPVPAPPASGVSLTPPAGVRVSSGATASQATGAAFAATVMPTPAQMASITSGLAARQSAGVAAVSAPAAAAGPAAAAARPRGAARLVLVQSDGTDGRVFELAEGQVDIGRTEGALTFEEDHYLAPRHARLERRNGHYVVLPLDGRNGIFVRLREPFDLHESDTFLVGKQVLRFERVPDIERDPAPAVEHGVHLFGTPVAAPWGRLCQMTGAGVMRDVLHLTRPEVVLGREEGDFVFPDDEFMSRRHVALSESRGRARIEDLGSSNGTYLRLKGERELRPGDMVRLGDQLLRFETV